VRLILGVVGGVLAGIYLLLGACFYFLQEALVYHPSHRATAAELTPWRIDGQLVGCSREPAAQPRAVWLIMQGNGGQAGLRGYFQHVPPEEALYILEYPGYGQRSGEPSREAINAAAVAAYHELRRRFPDVPVGVVGESFGSGPASQLALEPRPPDSLVLIVPVARFDLVLSRYVPFVPVRLLLRHNWDNLAALRDYRGPVTIYAAESDEVISREQTLLLAGSLPAARLVWVPGGHGATGENDVVRLGAAKR
jgi:hypothetical protein